MRTLWGSAALAAATVAGLLTTPTLARSADPEAGELQTAAQHADLAAKSKTLEQVDLHLHHTVNCLVGPKDKKFDADAGNPCQGQSQGALPDIKAQSSTGPRYHETEWTARLAQEALRAKNLDEARAAAHIVKLVLHGVEKTG